MSREDDDLEWSRPERTATPAAPYRFMDQECRLTEEGRGSLLAFIHEQVEPDDECLLTREELERAFTVFHLADGIPVAVTTVNTARDMRFARMIVQRGQAVDPAALANKAVKLQDLAR